MSTKSTSWSWRCACQPAGSSNGGSSLAVVSQSADEHARSTGHRVLVHEVVTLTSVVHETEGEPYTRP